MKSVYFFCGNTTKDHVAPHVLSVAKEMFSLTSGDLVFDGKPVLEYNDHNGNLFFFVETDEVLSHAFTTYLPAVKALFGDCDFAGLVNWHAGARAPENILTIHSIGDVPGGFYAPTHPTLYMNMLNALNNAIKENSLDGWRACTEATHWSGIVYGNKPEIIPEFNVPIYDIEIGSSAAAWSNPTAAKALASALIHVFDNNSRPRVLLAVGGVHFEPSFSDVGLLESAPVMCAHILPNQWLVSGGYNDTEGLEKMLRAADSIQGGIDGVVFHDNLGGGYKAVCRTLAERFNVPAFKHKALKDPARIKELLG